MPHKWRSVIRLTGLSILLAVALASARADAAVLAEDELAETSTEVGVIARVFFFGLFGDVLEPPLNPLEDANPAANSIFDLRLYAVRRTPSLKLVVHNQITARVSSHESLGPLSLGRSLEPPRLLPLRFEAADSATLQMTSTLEWVYAAWSRGGVTVTVGRQPVSFGRAKLWSPTDLVGTFALTEVDTEYKPGTDALRLDWSVGERFNLSVVAASGELVADNDLEATRQGTTVLARGQLGLSGGEAAMIVGYVRGDAVVGADVVWDAGSFDVYGEATATLVTDNSIASPVVDSGEVAARAVVGATLRGDTLSVSPELSWNGFGSFNRDDYLPLLLSGRVAVGEQTTIGRAYAGIIGDYELHPLLHISGVALVNVRDPSGLASLVLSHSVADNVQAVLGAYVPLGRAPSLAPLSTRSEYGLYPYFVFAELKAVI